jgi:D-alanyl-D-alanine carboxypeptidase (penicillin-binding protein 5/6)
MLSKKSRGSHLHIGSGLHERSRFSPTRRVAPFAAIILIIIVLLVIVGGIVQVVRSVPSPIFHSTIPTSYRVAGGPPALPWPSTGEAVVAVKGVGTVGSFGGDQEYSIASIAKIMTAYLVLKDHPLTPGSSGPYVTITPAEVAAYQKDAAPPQSQSVLPVAAGERLSERQMLEAILIPSANNIARILAVWNSGSIAAFVAQMNAEARALGMHHTHYVGPSGYNPGTVSTASDLLKLAVVAESNPVFASIVARPQASFPVAGVVENYNYDLGKDGIVGIKTGSEGDGTGGFVFDARKVVDGKPVTILGAVLGQGGLSPLETALGVGERLITAVTSMLRQQTIVSTGSRVGSISAPWHSGDIPVDTGATVSFLTWPGMRVHTRLTGSSHLPHAFSAGAEIGTLRITAESEKATVPVDAESSLSGPSLSWKLFGRL